MNLVIRADASSQIGTGHVMRCLALAQGWKGRGGQVTFMTACEKGSLLQRLFDEGFQVIKIERRYPDSVDWEMTSQVLATYPGAWVVLDGYHFDDTYQFQIKEYNHSLLVIDDMAHLSRYFADVVLNQNINAEHLSYLCEQNTHFLLGNSYVLLRSEFLTWRGRHREIAEVASKFLVSMGGSDPDNVTLKVIQVFNKIDLADIQVKILVGALNPHIESLQDAMLHTSDSMQLLQNVHNMSEMMAWADLAVVAGGSTCWELAFMGLPFLMIALAENQKSIADGLERAGVAENLGWFHKLTVERIAERILALAHNPVIRLAMSQKSQKLVDGLGAERTIDKMVSIR